MKTAQDIKNAFKKEHGLTDQELLFDDPLFREQASAEATCEACQGRVTCPLSPAGFQPSLSWDDRVVQTYASCPFVTPTGAITLMNIHDEGFAGKLDINPARADFLKYRKTLLEQVKKARATAGLYLYGPYGTGKTYLLVRLSRELAHLGKSATVIYYPDFAREVFQAMKEGTLEREMRALKDQDVLVLDDIGAENNTAYIRDEILVPLLQARMNARRLTFMTSNLDLATLQAHFAATKETEDVVKSARLVSWISSMMTVIKLEGEDHRVKGKED